MKPYLTESGPKQAMRDLMCDLAEQHLPRVRRAFTLPGDELLCAKTMLNRFGKTLQIVGVELKKDVCEKIKRGNDDVSRHVDPYQCTVKEYADSALHGRHFDLINLDFLGPLTPPRESELLAFVGNEKLVQPGEESILCLTLAKSPRGDSSLIYRISHTLELEKILDRDINHKNSLECMSRYLLTKLSELPNVNAVDLLESIEYRSDQKSQTMYFLAFKVCL